MKNVLIIIILGVGCVEVLNNSKDVINAVNFAFSIWRNNIFPSLFPFFVLSSIMVKYHVPEFIGELLKPIMNKLFKINGNAAFIFVMSLISGNPANAKYTRELYLNNLLNEYEATKILCFSCFANPLFILGTVTAFLNNYKIGFLLLFCHYIGNIIVGLLIRNYKPSIIKSPKISFYQALNKMRHENFGIIITKAITDSINTLLLILGVMCTCLVITTIIDNNININSTIQSVLNGFFEMTQGLKYISLENISLKLKAILCVVILSFGGFSVHIQIMSILSDTKVKYLPFLLCRIIHSIVSGILMFILFDFFHL